jgi:Domain of unknown function (DUF4878)
VGRIVPIICLLALFTGCGGGDDDKKDAEQAVRDFVTATREKDADAFCDELVTQEFLEQATGATGDQATQSCKREFDSLTGVDVRVVRIVRTEVNEDSARVTAVLARGGEELRQALRLKKEDGDWKLAGSAE